MTEQLEQDAAAVENATRLTTESIQRLLEQEQDGNAAVSLLTVAERDELIEEVSRIVPAGNVLSFVMNGILTSRERYVPDPNAGRSHLSAMFKGLSVMKDNLVYQLAFAGPATVLAGYNMLLDLAGADKEQFLPDGAWQFYVEFGLREDAAHHQTETTAFQKHPQAKAASPVNQLSAWVMACLELLHNYDDLLGLLWEENVRIETIEMSTGLPNLHREWQQMRPFAARNPQESLVAYRSAYFESFCKHHLGKVSEQQLRDFFLEWQTPAKLDEMGRRKRQYIRQMSLRRYMDPGEYSDEPVPINPEQLCIAVVYQDNYYLIDASAPFSLNNIATVRQQVNAILNSTAEPLSGIDTILAVAPRASQLKLRATLGGEQREQLEKLRKAPIIINWDEHNANQPLSYIRTGKRGIGDHALTLFRTGSSTVFDFSHIFFDGPWAMATAEILTNEAQKYVDIMAKQRGVLPPPQTSVPLNLHPPARFLSAAARLPQPVNYISAEIKRPLKPLQETRRYLRARTGIRLTINDLLVLYRTLFNQYYEPSAPLRQQLEQVQRAASGTVLVRNVENMFARTRRVNPSLLIPIDASRYDPKERLFPSTFRSPMPDLRTEHEALLQLLQMDEPNPLLRLLGNRSDRDKINAFLNQREHYLGYLRAFSVLMQKYREIALNGGSMSATAIRLIAGLSPAMQKIVNDIPGQFSVVNDAIKGEEVFSNVGRVVPTSSITRFASAKDDNDKKVLVWGVMTDVDDQLTVTLRDFRPTVLELARNGHPQVAQAVTADFLTAYVDGLYAFSHQLREIVIASKSKRRQ